MTKQALKNQTTMLALKHQMTKLALKYQITKQALKHQMTNQALKHQMTCRWFSPGTPVSSTNKTDQHDITEILMKVALNTIKQTNKPDDKTSIEIPDDKTSIETPDDKTILLTLSWCRRQDM
jgi:hypothetical protein